MLKINVLFLILSFFVIIYANEKSDEVRNNNLTPVLDKAKDTTQLFSDEHKNDHLKEKLQEFSSRRFYKVDKMYSNQTLVLAELKKRNMIEIKNSKWGWAWENLNVVNDKQIVNHFPNFHQIGTKSGLTVNLNKLRNENPEFQIESFFPRSYVLSDKNERNSFIIDYKRHVQQIESNLQLDSNLNDVPSIEQFGITSNSNNNTFVYPPQPHIDGDKNIWIVKPSTLARGVGIKVFTDLDKLLEYSNKHDNHFIAQKYVEKPFLILDRKFDIRQFVLVKSLNPLTIFLYKDCYLRFCSIEYSTENIDDKFAHLSNHQVQKEYLKENESPIPHNQWPLSKFKSLLKEKNNGKDIWEDLVFERLKNLVIKTIKSWPQDGHRNNSFELLGFDIMITENYEPILIEVNTNPGLHLLTDVVNVHHPNAVRDLFKVVLDNQDKWEQNHRDTKWIMEQSTKEKNQLFGDWEPIYSGAFNPNIKSVVSYSSKGSRLKTELKAKSPPITNSNWDSVWA